MKALDLLFAARPILLLPLWSIFLVCFRYHQVLSGKSFGSTELAVLAIFSAIAAAAYYINQVIDYDSDLLNDKLGFLQRRILTSTELTIWAIALTIVSLIASTLITTWFTVSVAFAVFCAYAYSLPPISLMKRPWPGMLANALTFGFVVPLSVMPEMYMHNSALLGWNAPLFFLLAVAAIHILTTIPDMEGDRRTGKVTIALKLGPGWSKILAFVFLLSAAYIAYDSQHTHLIYLALISAAVLILTFISPSLPLLLFAVKLPILLTALLAGLFYPLYLVIIVVLLVATRLYYRKRFGIYYPKLS